MTTWQKSFVGSDKAELPVKLDYSDTYRENDQLDLDLFEHLAELHRAQRRRLMRQRRGTGSGPSQC
ncbi:hypothetical protein C0Q70_11785 [Pomacea canaliculata]|uniref:Uncharacterized protein n=1 Tax=Pomacea canaliculata TaxID=400727 RepID=A0A2T7P6Y7_POMCA|nr:hypothetical protein C0Q70_11785 [Pomacea canaliculata]